MSLTRFFVTSSASLILLSCGSAPSAEEEAAAKSQLEERIATVINLSGNLCARVTFVSPLIGYGEYKGEYQVNCDEYRNPKLSKNKNNTAVYMVNPDSYAVRFMGRG